MDAMFNSKLWMVQPFTCRGIPKILNQYKLYWLLLCQLHKRTLHGGWSRPKNGRDRPPPISPSNNTISITYDTWRWGESIHYFICKYKSVANFLKLFIWFAQLLQAFSLRCHVLKNIPPNTMHTFSSSNTHHYYDSFQSWICTRSKLPQE